MTPATKVERGRFKSKAGFTLIEVMLVIAVISIIAVVSVPKYQALTDHYHLESSAQAVSGRLRYAKQAAMDLRQTVYVGLTNNGVQVFNASGSPVGEFQAFDAGISFSDQAGSGLSSILGTGYTGVAYDYRGFVLAGGCSSNPGFAACIPLTSARTGQSVHINIGSGTGYVTIGSP
ncbi:hypothetical protein JCM15765_09230 [Paradesulfitobacterium aromaticivorans]